MITVSTIKLTCHPVRDFLQIGKNRKQNFQETYTSQNKSSNTNFKKYCYNRIGIKLLSDRHRVVAIA